MVKVTEMITFDIPAKDLKRIGIVGGWAPGSYMGKCFDCDGEITGDKRAILCLPCAVIALKASLDRRDKFIADRGLWQDFVDTLPKTQPKI